MMNLMLLRAATLLFTSGALIGCAETPDSAVSGVYGNVIRFLPPVVITDELLKDALGVLAEGFAAL
jgi:F0F1-type ATP synthase assembly protein I